MPDPSAPHQVHGCPVHAEFDPLSEDFLADPYSILAGLPADGADVFYAPSIGYYVVTRYSDIEQVFSDPATYSAAVAQAPLVPLVSEAQQILRDLVDVKAAEPGDDLATDLLAISDENPDRLSRDEIGSILFSLSFAGHETTTGLIGNTVRRLLEDPARWTEIVRQPDLIPGAVDETLRFDPSVPVWRRVATKATTLSGVDLAHGAKLFLWLAAAGRDGAVFANPDDFDVHRPDADRHLAFGKGLHYCLGANLGRLETQIAVTELARRYPNLRLAPDQRLTFHPNISFRGPQSLPVRVL